MKTKATIYVLSLILPMLFAFSTYANFPRGHRPQINYASLSPELYKSGVIRIKFSEEASGQIALQPFTTQKSGQLTTGILDFDLLVEEYGITEGSKIIHLQDHTTKSQSVPVLAGRHSDWGFDRWYEFSLNTKSEVGGIIDAFSKLESVDIAEPVFNVYPVHNADFETAGFVGTSKSDVGESYSNDPSFTDQWSLQNLGQAGGVPGSDIDLIKAWEMQKGNREVIIAVIDGGIKYDHPDLADNMWVDSDGNHGFNFADGNNIILPNNHATHVAGIISAVSNNDEGIAGIAGGSGLGDGVKLMIAQVFSENRSGGFHLAPVYAADNGAAITQNSWVYGAPGIYDHLALDAIDYFNTYGGGVVMDGGITIFAAGNHGKDGLYYPACYEGVIAVASTNQSDQKAASSNFGNWIDLSAPGVGIMSTLANNKYGTSSGTSMASPHVSGVAALIISEAAGQITAQQLKDILLSTAESLDSENPAFSGMLGNGRINAFNALNAVRALLFAGTIPGTDEEPATGDETTSPSAFFFLSDGDWNDLSNWFIDANGEHAALQLPASTDAIQVFAAASHSGEIRIEGNGSISIHGGGTLITESLTNYAGAVGHANLIIKPGAGLTVTDQLSDINNDNFILVQSDATGSGSLIHNNDNIQASFEYHTYGNGNTWEMLSLPVSGPDVSNNPPAWTLYNWYEPELKWIELNSSIKMNVGSLDDGSENTLSSGRGYLVNYNAEVISQQDISFAGSLHTDDFSFSLSHLASTADAFSGYNLLGNPYASSIDWNDDNGWTGRDNLDGNGGQGYTMWIWNRETGNYGSYNSASNSSLGTLGISRYIAPMQAFWVKTTDNNREMTVKQQARTHGGNTGENSPSGNTPEEIRLTVSSEANSYSDELILEFGHSTAKGGAEKMFSMLEEAPGLYTSEEDAIYSIRFLDSPVNHPLIPVGFTAGANGSYTISAQINENYNSEVVLIDQHNGSRHDLSINGAYSFYANAGDDAERFVLQLGNEQTTGTHLADAEVPGIFFSNGQLNIHNPWDNKADVSVYNLSGATIASFDSAPHSYGKSTLDASPGVYVVRMISEGRQYTSKVLTW